MRISKILIILGLFSLIFSFPLSANPRKKVLIIDIPRLTFEDLNNSPNLVNFLETGSVGVIAVSVAESEKVYLDFNSGVQLRIPSKDVLSMFNANEGYKGFSVGELYQSLTGYQVSKDSGVHLDLAKIFQLNTGSAALNIGRLGRLFHQYSFKTAAIGNADADLINRGGSVLVMDEKGQIDLAAIGRETLRRAPEFPYGWVTDNEKVKHYWQEFKKGADVLVITLGDLERLERFSQYLSDERWGFYRRMIVNGYDRLFGEMRQMIDFNSTMAIVFTAVPPQRKAGIGEKLAPVVIKGPGFKPGTLYSGSTRKAGIITEYDLPTSILKFLGIQKSGSFNGQSLRSVPGNWRKVAALRPKLVANYNLRWPLITGYGYLAIASILAGLAGLIFEWRPVCFKMLTYIYLALSIVPAIFLIEALLNPLNWTSIIGWTLGLTLLFLTAAIRISGSDSFKTITLISFITVLIILGDGLGNGFLEYNSFLGYSMVAGARFYGIGNEYLGILIGAYTVLISNFKGLPKHRPQILWIGTCFIGLLVAHPNFGANIGGGITVLLGLGITNYLLLKKPVRIKEIGLLLISSLVLLIVVGFWDLFIRRDSMTHFGQLLFLIKEEGFPVIYDVFLRKWELNLRLIAYTPWTKVLVGILVLTPLLYYKPPKVITELLRKYPEQLKGFLGLVVTALIALVVNDSGIVAVATMFIFGATLLLMVLFEEWNLKRSVCE